MSKFDPVAPKQSLDSYSSLNNWLLSNVQISRNRQSNNDLLVYHYL